MGGTVTLCLIVASLRGLEAHIGSGVGVRGTGVVVVLGVVCGGLLGGGAAVGVGRPSLIRVHAAILVGCPVSSCLELHGGLGCMVAVLGQGGRVGHRWDGLLVEGLGVFFVGFFIGFFLMLWGMAGWCSL